MQDFFLLLNNVARYFYPLEDRLMFYGYYVHVDSQASALPVEGYAMSRIDSLHEAMKSRCLLLLTFHLSYFIMSFNRCTVGGLVSPYPLKRG